MKQYKFIFSLYLCFLFLFATFFLSAVHNLSVNNSMAEWVINYQGGFTRRGFLGEFVFQISQLFDLQLRKTFLGFQILIYLIYFYGIYNLFKKINFNYIFALAIFSPLFFLFSLAEQEALGRKDIFMFLVFVLNFLIFFKFQNKTYNYLYFYISFPIVFLTHEIYIIYIGYFLTFLILIEENINLKFFIKFILVLIFISFFLNMIISNEFTSENLKLLCKNLKEQSNENCGLAPTSMVVNLAGYRSEVGWQITHIFRYFMIFLFGFSGLLILITFSKINKSKMNYFSSKINLKILFFLLALPSILPFLTAVD